MATPRNAFRTPRANQENSGIANHLMNKGGLLSARKHGSTKHAFGDVQNTFKPNNGEQNFQKPTPMKVFNKQLENVKVMTPTVKQKNNLCEEIYDKCSYKKMRDDSYYWYTNSVWTDSQMNDFIKKSNAEPEPVDFPMPEPPSFDLSQFKVTLPDISLDISLPELPEFNFDMDCLPELPELDRDLDRNDPDFNLSFNLISFDD